MPASPMTIRVKPGSALDRLLEKAGSATIELERAGVRYLLTRVEPDTTTDTWAAYAPDKAIAGMRAAAGSWSDLDAEAVKDYLYRAREGGSRPLDRP